MRLECEGDLIMLYPDKRTDTVLLSADQAMAAHRALEQLWRMAWAKEREKIVAGGIIRPRNPFPEVWDLKVQLFQKGPAKTGVAIRINRHTSKVPMIPAIARELSAKLRGAAQAVMMGASVRILPISKMP